MIKRKAQHRNQNRCHSALVPFADGWLERPSPVLLTPSRSLNHRTLLRPLVRRYIISFPSPCSLKAHQTSTANLATFTTYHAITNRYNFWSYIAFFVILWSSWFHVVCFDSRFAFDSIWERACKTVHFCAFATFALVGYKFSPVAASDQAATPQWVCINRARLSSLKR